MPAASPKEQIAAGQRKVEWVRAHMPILEEIRSRMERERPFAGHRLSLVLHVEAKTAALALTVQAAGGDVKMAASNPLSTDDEVVAYLNDQGLETLAKKGESLGDYTQGIKAMVEHKPDYVIDDGADLIVELVNRGKKVKGSTEETTTGIIRLRALEHDKKLAWPAIDVNDATMKHLFDNRYGTGQSTLDGIFSATNLTIAGKTAVVAGYGWCGKGVASRLRGLGADVIVTEIDPAKAVEARLEGYRVMRMIDAAPHADLIVTVTGCADVVRGVHYKVLKDGCLLANAGHFDVEINKKDLAGLAIEQRRVRPMVEEFRFADGRRAYLLAEGRLVNLAAGQGHPAEIMDMSFALQALSAEHLVRKGDALGPGVHAVPPELDELVARAALRSYGANIDVLTSTQADYLRSWRQ